MVAVPWLVNLLLIAQMMPGLVEPWTYVKHSRPPPPPEPLNAPVLIVDSMCRAYGEAVTPAPLTVQVWRSRMPKGDGEVLLRLVIVAVTSSGQVGLPPIPKQRNVRSHTSWSSYVVVEAPLHRATRLLAPVPLILPPPAAASTPPASVRPVPTVISWGAPAEPAERPKSRASVTFCIL